MHLTVRETISRYIKIKKAVSFNILFHSLFIFSICIILSSIFKKIPLLKILVP